MCSTLDQMVNRYKGCGLMPVTVPEIPILDMLNMGTAIAMIRRPLYENIEVAQALQLTQMTPPGLRLQDISLLPWEWQKHSLGSALANCI